MSGSARVTAIVGSYRKGGVVDSAVEEILAAAREAGAEVEKIWLLDKHIEFCTNCRACTQAAGLQPGKCPVADDMPAILDELERSDAIVLGSPMNFWTVTAVMKRFIERLICFAYWPWGVSAPKLRNRQRIRRVVVVGSSACPAVLARLMTGMVGLLKSVARVLGARKIDVLFIGLAAQEQRQDIGRRARAKARRLGRELACR
jgi:multimeric flavodoxin WrbA